MIKKYIFTICACLACYLATAQPFSPDKNGHIADPKFLKLIRSRGYELVGAFDTVQFDPLQIVAPFQKNGKWGRIDNYGKVIAEAKGADYDPVIHAREIKGDTSSEFHSYTRPYNRKKANFTKHSDGSGLYGTRDSLGREGIPAQYQQLNIYTAYSDTVAIVNSGGIYGAFTTSGKPLVPLDYDRVMISFTGNGAFTVTKGKLLGVYHHGHEVIPARFERIAYDNRFKNLVKVTDTGKTALFNLDGKQLTPFKYGQIADFSQAGLALYSVGGGMDTKMGLIDTLGKQIGIKEYHNITWFSPTAYRVINNTTEHHSEAGLINLKNELITTKFYGRIEALINGLAKVSNGNYQFIKTGFIDSLGNEVIKPEYTAVENFNKAGFAVITVDGKQGLINRKGGVVVKPVYDLISFNPSRKEYYIEQNKKRGLMDMQGNIKLQPAYDKLYAVGKYGYRAVIGDKQGLLDDNGQVIAAIKYDEIAQETYHKVIDNGIAAAVSNGKKIRIDMYGNEYAEKGIVEGPYAFKPDKDGYVSGAAFQQFIKEHGFQLVSLFDTLSKQPPLLVAKVMIEGRWKFIDTKGQFVPGLERGERLNFGSDIKVTEQKGVADVMIDAPMNTDTSGFEQVITNGKYGTLNKTTGKTGLPAIYDGLSFMSDGHVIIKLDGKYGMGMTDGRILFQPQYESVTPVTNKKGFDYSQYFVKAGGKYGLISANGAIIIPAKYDQLQTVGYNSNSDRLLRAQLDKKWGLITKKGDVMVIPAYDELNPLSPGLFKTGMGTYPKQYGLIDTTGKVLLEPLYKYVEFDHYKNVIRISLATDKGTKEGYLTKTGKMLFKPVYDMIGDFSGGTAIVELNGKFGMMTAAEKVIIEPKYDRLFILRPGQLLGASIAGKEGLLDMKGNTVIPMTYDQLYPDGANFVFKRNEKWGLMTRKEEVLASFPYDEILPGYNCFVVQAGGRYGIMGNDGKLITAIKYGRFSNAEMGHSLGLARTSLNGHEVIIDLYGNEYLPGRGFDQ